MGLNVGKGTYLKDMHTRDHAAFLAITKKLNLDPDKTPVSKKVKAKSPVAASQTANVTPASANG